MSEERQRECVSTLCAGSTVYLLSHTQKRSRAALPARLEEGGQGPAVQNYGLRLLLLLPLLRNWPEEGPYRNH